LFQFHPILGFEINFPLKFASYSDLGRIEVCVTRWRAAIEKETVSYRSHHWSTNISHFIELAKVYQKCDIIPMQEIVMQGAPKSDHIPNQTSMTNANHQYAGF
jgi:hypothetical protein